MTTPIRTFGIAQKRLGRLRALGSTMDQTSGVPDRTKGKAKAVLQQEWQGDIGDVWAREWRRTDRSFAGLQSVLVERAARLAREMDGGTGAKAVLDIGCGAGTTTLALAGRLSEARLLGVDISSSLVGIATERASSDTRCTFSVADAAAWHDSDFRPDLLFSRHGMMFFDDPIAAFSHLRENAVAKARLIFSCFRSVFDNGWASGIAALLPDGAPLPAPDAPGPFAFADPERVGDILSAAGWVDARPEAVDFRYIAGTGEGDDRSAVADALSFFQQIGPAARAIKALEGDARAVFLDRLEALLTDHVADGVVTFPAAAWIWTARKGTE